MSDCNPARRATALIRDAVDDGNYASSDEVVREAPDDWKTKRTRQLREFGTLKADTHRGLADLTDGRVQELDVARIIERAKSLSTKPLPLSLTGAVVEDSIELFTILAFEASEKIASQFLSMIQTALSRCAITQNLS